MYKKTIYCLIFCLLLWNCGAFAQDYDEGAQQQEQTQQNPESMAQKEVERLTELLDLEDWQVFYIDSTLQNNFREWFAELSSLQRSGATNTDLYYAVMDKWQMRNEAAYKSFFSEAQWKKYMKNEGDKIIRDREKRLMKREEATHGKQKKSGKGKK